MRRCKECKAREARSGRYYCPTCANRRWRAAHPVEHMYYMIRASALRCEIPITIKRWQWVLWCRWHGLTHRGGLKGDSWTIDRVDASRGYSLDNIQLMTMRENSRKARTEDLPF